MSSGQTPPFLLANRKAVETLAKRYGIQPHRRLSQNFLIDPTILEQMLHEARLHPGDHVLEVGAGFGVLTEALLSTGATVHALEIDECFAVALRDRFQEKKNFLLTFADFLVWYPEHVAELRSYPFQIISNLPYHLSSRFFRTVLESPTQPARVLVMVQWEVAERITAAPGEMSLLSLSVQNFGEPRILQRVPRTSFWPAPEVDSALLVIDAIHAGAVQTRPVFQLARMAFSNRRKQLQNSLAAGCDVDVQEVLSHLQSTGIKGTARPQELSVASWHRLAEAFAPLLQNKK